MTHSGIKVPCILVNNGKDIINFLSKNDLPHAIAVDEAFMIDNISDACLDLFYNKRIDVLISTLDMSSSLTAFDEICTLMGHATHIKKCKAVCTVCGEDAAYTMRKNEHSSTDLIQIGGEDIYEARCLKHHAGIEL